MQEKTSSPDHLQAKENVLIRRSELINIKKANNLIYEAQKRAKALIKEAQAQAEEIQKGAYLTGYQQGIVCSVEAMSQFFADHHQHQQEVLISLKEGATAFLKEALNDEQIVSHLLTKWIDEVNEGDQETVLYLVMPTSAKTYHAAIKAIIDGYHHLRLVLRYHDQPAFVFKYRSRLVEFSPDQLADATISRMIPGKEIYQQCRQLSQDALDALHNAIDCFHLSNPETNSE